MATLEHINVTVSDARATALFLKDLLGWEIRWEGKSSIGGESIHVGGESSYLALFTPDEPQAAGERSKKRIANLNHIGIVVDDLEEVAERLRKLGVERTDLEDYEPGLRFYFDGPDGVEYEIVSYA